MLSNPISALQAAMDKLQAEADTSEFSIVPTSRGLFALVEKCMHDQVMAHRWYAVIAGGGHVYAVADIDGKRLALQRYVMKIASPQRSYDEIKNVSFRNKVTFDCRLANLDGLIGRQAAMRNRRPKRNTSSKFKGVIRLSTPDGSVRWRAQIKFDETAMSVGIYDDEIKAAAAYDAAATLVFDGAAHLNFPNQEPDPDTFEIARAKIAQFRERRKRRRLKASADS